MKALYAELNDALREEGGLLGRPPSAEQLRAINRAQGLYQSPLTNEDYPSAGGRRSSATRAGARSTGTLARQDRGAQPARGRASAQNGFSKPRTARGFSRKDGG
jgi:hypothetical protein